MIPAAKLSVFPFYNILLHIYKSKNSPYIRIKASLIDAKSPISTKKRTIRIPFNFARIAGYRKLSTNSAGVRPVTL